MPAAAGGPAAKKERDMIIDCHAHVFQSWEGACGYPSSEIHRKYMQKVQTRTSARIFRGRDGKPASGAVLFNQGENGWSGLDEVNFRVGNYGRLDFTIEGEDYHSQYMPVGMQQIVAILPVRGADLVGPLPGELQNIIVYAAGIAAAAANPDAAAAFIGFMATAEAVRIIRAVGLDPG